MTAAVPGAAGAPADPAPTWAIRGRTLDLARPVLMGILNVTPDSFSDGGRHRDPDAAIAAGLAMAAEGATIIDIGGESTRPGAARVPAEIQIDRTRTVIEAIAARSDVAISIDTTRGLVARAALAAGAHIVNDVSGGTEDGDLLVAAAEAGAGLVLMHRLRPPEADAYSDRYETPPVYADPAAAVRTALAGHLAAAMAAGVQEAAIVLDPGLGFGKSVEDNWRLVAGTSVIADLGRPILSGTSRKSFVGAVTGRSNPADRLAGSVAAAVLHARLGVRILRVHDVAAHADALAVLAAVDAAAATDAAR